jgi:hypothetical protein
MSLLAPEIHSALSQLLRALTTPDNAVRSQAEDQLNNDWVQNRPDILLMGLAEQLQGAEDAVVRTLEPLMHSLRENNTHPALFTASRRDHSRLFFFDG